MEIADKHGSNEPLGSERYLALENSTVYVCRKLQKIILIYKQTSQASNFLTLFRRTLGLSWQLVFGGSFTPSVRRQKIFTMCLGNIVVCVSMSPTSNQ